jgi:uncharacterized protein YdeI (YjbR/CyaY-like superfamily)
MTIDTPQYLTEALEKAGLREFFSGCTTAHRREYLKWIGEAKRPETRKARIERAMQLLSSKRAEERARANKRA